MTREEIENSMTLKDADVYSQGYNDGIKDGKESVQIDETAAYKAGLEAAWRLARELPNLGYNEARKEIFGEKYGLSIDIIKAFSVTEVADKIKEYEEKQKQDDDEIKVGDEIKNKWGTSGVVVEIAPQYNGATVYSVLWRNAERRCLDKSDWDSYVVWKKTGRHFPQIEEVLEQMKGEEE